MALPRAECVGMRCAVATVVGLAVTVAGCSTANPPADSPTSSALPTPAVSASPSQAPSVAATDAVARARTFVATIDRLSSNPQANLDELSTVARGKAASKWRQIIFDDRSAGHRQTGKTSMTVMASKAGPSDQQRIVTMCLDVSRVDVVDREGKSVVDKTRPDRVRDVLTVDQDAKSSQWYVTRDTVTATC